MYCIPLQSKLKWAVESMALAPRTWPLRVSADRALSSKRALSSFGLKQQILIHQRAMTKPTKAARGEMTINNELETQVAEDSVPTEKNPPKERERLEVGGIVIEGHSIGGQQTCIILPGLKLAFDIGRCPQRAVAMPTICVTHGHLDHIGGLHLYVASRSLQSASPPSVLLPTKILDPARRFLNAAGALDHSSLQCELIGVDCTASAEKIQLPHRPNLVIAAFPTKHPVPSQGYVVYERRNKLKAQYHGLPGSEIAKIRQSGAEVSEAVDTPLIAFTGDTLSSWMDSAENHPVIRDALRATVLITEATFLEATIAQSKAWEKYGHTHLEEIANREELLANVGHLVLCHFSPRYSAENVHDALRNVLSPALYSKTTPLLHDFQ